MKDIAVLLVAFLAIGLLWRRFSAGARMALLGVIVVVVAYMTIRQA